MKKLLSSLCLLATLTLVTPAFAQPNKDISVSVDGLPVSFDVKPLIQDNRTLVPFRALAESLNVQVTWDQKNQTIQAQGNQTNITLRIGQKTARQNGTQVNLDVPPQVISGRTLVPLRFFSEAFQCQVNWQPAQNAIAITSPPRPMEVLGFYALGDQRTSSWTNLFGQPFPNTSQGHTGVVDSLGLGWYSLDQAGTLLTKSRTGWQRPEDYEKVLGAAGQYKLRTEMVIHVTDEDNTLTNLLTNPSASEQAVSAIAEEAEHYQGVNLDFEGLGLSSTGAELIQVRESLNGFVALLAAELKQRQIPLALSLHAPNSAYQGYDYQKLGQLADQIIVMAYDYGSKPEPTQQVLQAIQSAKSLVPAQKLLLGISLPNETPESLAIKIGLAKRHNLQGVALWRLGLVSSEMWTTLESSITPN